MPCLACVGCFHICLVTFTMTNQTCCYEKGYVSLLISSLPTASAMSVGTPKRRSCRSLLDVNLKAVITARNASALCAVVRRQGCTKIHCIMALVSTCNFSDNKVTDPIYTRLDSKKIGSPFLTLYSKWMRDG